MAIDPIAAVHASDPNLIGDFYPHLCFVFLDGGHEKIQQLLFEKERLGFFLEPLKADDGLFNPKKVDLIAVNRSGEGELFYEAWKETVD